MIQGHAILYTPTQLYCMALTALHNISSTLVHASHRRKKRTMDPRFLRVNHGLEDETTCTLSAHSEPMNWHECSVHLPGLSARVQPLTPLRPHALSLRLKPPFRASFLRMRRRRCVGLVPGRPGSCGRCPRSCGGQAARLPRPAPPMLSSQALSLDVHLACHWVCVRLPVLVSVTGCVG